MISLIKFIIWIVGFIVVSIFVLNYFGYEINQNYFKESKAECEKRLSDCGKQYMEQGTKNAKCDFNCVDPKLIIRKK
ncbi:MAG: hypothetical protein COS71_00445 [Candidatus Moranbacteria bacterium CG06_land_8_20_14_3_00_40_12]|nr:MAG: hypothetical protein COX31_01955 [Candidatus Moranbacteria bacterium CG23_combo_of_CG06-09_8_20_14_all_40_16]PIU81011.1 MAG: hypothetical protein COS71_00445 [Candidatus Moranbacteria bacterium CG06_land_8_20_14_3_00_40_12]